MALNAKQRAFVREYQKDKNATQAAIRAGYSKKTAKQQGSALLSKPDVAGALAKLESAAAEEAKLDRAWVLERLKIEATESDNAESARIRAVELIGKAVEGGIFTDKREVDVGKKLEDILREADEEE